MDKGLRVTTTDILNERRNWNKRRRRDTRGGMKHRQQNRRHDCLVLMTQFESARDYWGRSFFYALILKKKERLSTLRQKKNQWHATSKRTGHRKQDHNMTAARVITDCDVIIVMTKRHVVYLVFCHNFWLHVKHKTLLKCLKSTGKNTDKACNLTVTETLQPCWILTVIQNPLQQRSQLHLF